LKLYLRKADRGDFEELNRLIKQVDLMHHRNLPNIFKNNPPPARSPEYLFSIIDDDNKDIIVAESENKLLGFVVIHKKFTPDITVLFDREYAVIDNIAVDKEYRRKGIGKALMKKAHKWARKKGITKIELNVFEFNKNALQFYKNLGYKTRSRKMAINLGRKEN